VKIVITGAAGLVGRELARVYEGHEVIPLGHADLDITDAGAVSRSMVSLRPDIIFNCAVIGVDDCERDPVLARAVNVAGPAALAGDAEELGAVIVHFSSNYVFDGQRDSLEPYTIDDGATPINVYGVTKLAGELAVAAACSRAFVIRTSWVFGQVKRSFLSTVASALRKGEGVTAITDTFASTTFVEDLAPRVREVVERGLSGTYHLVNSGVCSYEIFAHEAARLAGVQLDLAAQLIAVTTEKEMHRAAPRPRWTAMRCLLSEQLGLSPMRSWQEALADYVAQTRMN